MMFQTFPVSEEDKAQSISVLLIDFGQPGLPSPDHDVVTWSSLLQKRLQIPPQNIQVLVGVENESKERFQKIRAQLDPLVHLKPTPNKIDVFNSCKAWTAGNESKHYLFLLSGHGFYCGQNADYAVHSATGETINTHEWHDALFSKLEEKAVFLGFVDTCSSGSMLGIDKNKPEKGWVASISACADGQSDNDDISDFGHFGGGLTSAFCDEAVYTNERFLKMTETIAWMGARLGRSGQTLTTHSNK